MVRITGLVVGRARNAETFAWREAQSSISDALEVRSQGECEFNGSGEGGEGGASPATASGGGGEGMVGVFSVIDSGVQPEVKRWCSWLYVG